MQVCVCMRWVQCVCVVTKNFTVVANPDEKWTIHKLQMNYIVRKFAYAFIFTIHFLNWTLWHLFCTHQFCIFTSTENGREEKIHSVDESSNDASAHCNDFLFISLFFFFSLRLVQMGITLSARYFCNYIIFGFIADLPTLFTFHLFNFLHSLFRSLACIRFTFFGRTDRRVLIANVFFMWRLQLFRALKQWILTRNVIWSSDQWSFIVQFCLTLWKCNFYFFNFFIHKKSQAIFSAISPLLFFLFHS